MRDCEVFSSIRKTLIFEVTEEFVRDYNRATPLERKKHNELIYRMLQRLKVKMKKLINRLEMKRMRIFREKLHNVKFIPIDLFNYKWLGNLRFKMSYSNLSICLFARAELCLLSQCKSSYQEGK